MAAIIQDDTTITHRFAAAPLVLMPLAVVLLGDGLPAWVFMWALALSIFAGLKWLTYVDDQAARDAPLLRRLGYLFLWPGMDAGSFFLKREVVPRPLMGQWCLALAKLTFGLGLIGAAIQIAIAGYPLAAAWTAMVGIVFALHFGLFHVLALGWQRAGFAARPIMDAPVLSASVSDFWGRRWNRAFRDLGHRYVFRPLHRRLGAAGATMAVFVASGVVHDVVISLPARGGFGLPTLYFAIQGLGLLLERSEFARRIGLRHGPPARVFCFVVVLVPLPLLFHWPFAEYVILPMLHFLGA